MTKIAIIDSNEQTLEELKNEFKDGNYQVTTCNTFQKGIDILQGSCFDILILKYDLAFLTDTNIITLVNFARQNKAVNNIVLLSDKELPQLPQHILELIDASLSDCKLLSINDFSKYLKKFIRKSQVKSHDKTNFVSEHDYQNQQHYSNPSLIGYNLNRYRILEHLGGSDITSVYKALDTKSEQTVVLKCLSANVEDDIIQKRFIREGKLVSELKHPNINYVYGIEESADGRLFIVMSYIQGRTLEEHLSYGNLPLVETLHYALQIAQGLAYAHEQKVIHRDIKPSNVMITPEGDAKLLDFGVAKINLEQGNSQSLTRQGSLLGTVAYMSPEQLLSKKVKEYADCWAFGLLLYVMLTGEHPFMASNASYNALNLIEDILEKTPQPASALYPHIPDRLDTLITQLLRKEPYQARPQMHEVIDELEYIKKGITASLKSVLS